VRILRKDPGGGRAGPGAGPRAGGSGNRAASWCRCWYVADLW